jgi:hypothetical protein
VAHWDVIVEAADPLFGVERTSTSLSVAGTTFVRRVDDATVAFAVDDDTERDALIARLPDVYFTTAKYSGLPLVLAHLRALTEPEVQERTRRAWQLSATPEVHAGAARRREYQAKQLEYQVRQREYEARIRAPVANAPVADRAASSRCYYLAFVSEDQREHRTFRELGPWPVAGWLRRAWNGQGGLGRLPGQQRRWLEQLFESAEEEEVERPNSDDEALSVLLQYFRSEDHLFSAGDDFEGVAWEIYVFDDEYLKSDASDYLPHPERGERDERSDDGYRELLRRYHKHVRTS